MPNAYLSTQELAAKYPLPDMADAERAWYRLCMRWRDQGRLKPREHWKYTRRNGIRTRVYLEVHLLRLVWVSDRPFCQEVCGNHRETIVQRIRVAAL